MIGQNEELFLSSSQDQAPWSGVKALHLAVLKDAIECLQGLEVRSVRTRQLAQRAKRWIESDDWESVFSFNNVCSALEVAPAWVRCRLPNAARAGRARSRRTERRSRVRPPRERARARAQALLDDEV